ncbi:MAG TPA: hypothetical protein VLA52_13585, partial [Thermohalobaculum sp.]|nr:hypothetical protein [Thermohalobaculum sp.]
GEPNSENGETLNLTNMPENFHPAATWVRLSAILFSFVLSSYLRPIFYYLFSKFGNQAIIFSWLMLIPALAPILYFYSTRIQSWFPRPLSTKSWASRVSIGWNLHLSKIEAMGFFRFMSSREDRLPTYWSLILVFIFFVDPTDNWVLLVIYPILCVGLVFVLAEQKRRLAEKIAASDPRVAKLIY